MNRTEKYTEILATMIRTETISSHDNKDLTKFLNFHEVLKQLFPHLFSIAEIQVFDGSLLLKWHGSDSSLEPICLMNHHDVVEATGQWAHDPFTGVVEDGKLYGRGTLDTKGGLFGMLQAADELIEEGYLPKRDIYFESACNEEINGAGCDQISKYLQENNIHFYFTLDEGGMIVDGPITGVSGKWAMIGVGEKGTCDLKFTAHSNGGHASTPGKNTPLVRLGKFMNDVDHSHIFTPKLNPVIKEMFIRMAPSMNGPLKKILENTEKLEGILTHVAPAISPTLNALARTTLAFTVAKGSDAHNVLPQTAYVIGNMRFSHHQGKEKSIAAVTKFAKKYGIETEVIDDGFSSDISDFNSEPFKLVEKAVDEIFPGVQSCPYIMTGASDSRFMNRVSENCLRFVPFVVSSQQVSTIHGLNENVDVETLEKAVDFFRYILQNN